MKTKFSRRILCLSLAAGLSLALYGCGTPVNQDEPSPADNKTETQTEAQSQETPSGDTAIWSYLGESYTAFASGFNADDVESLDLVINGEAQENFRTEDTDLIDQVFHAMDQICVTEKTDAYADDSDQIFTFTLNDGNDYRIAFNDNNLSTESGIYLLENDADLWDATIDLRDHASDSYIDATDQEQTEEAPDYEDENSDPNVDFENEQAQAEEQTVAEEDAEDPQAERGTEQQTTDAADVAPFSYEQASGSGGTEYTFGNSLIITIPNDWNGKYAMEQGDNYVTFYHTASHEAWMNEDGSDGGVLFGIYYGDGGEGGDDLGVGADGGHYYLSYPSDMQAYSDDDDILNEYMDMADEIDSIASNAYSTVTN